MKERATIQAYALENDSYWKSMLCIAWMNVRVPAPRPRHNDHAARAKQRPRLPTTTASQEAIRKGKMTGGRSCRGLVRNYPSPAT